MHSITRKPGRCASSAMATAALLTVMSGMAHGDLPITPGWYAVPNTKLESVCAAKNGFPQITGVQGCPAILNWSGGVYDSKRFRLIVWGGGHNDYYGNEIYAFNLQNLTLTRLNDPGLPIATTCSASIANGTQANSRHTYDGIEYMPNVDRMFVFGGAPACPPGATTDDTWTFDFTNMQWQRMNPSGPVPRPLPGVMTAYDPNTGLIFLHDNYDLYSYSFQDNRFTRLTSGGTYVGYHRTATIDPVRKRFVIVGSNSGTGTGNVLYFDISPGSSYQLQTANTTGGASVIGTSYPGLEYDPVTDRIVAWNGGNTAYALNPDTNTWNTFTYTGGPGAANPWSSTGTLGRWRYVPDYNVFVLLNNVTQNVHTLRVSGPGTPPPNDTTPPIAPLNLNVD